MKVLRRPESNSVQAHHRMRCDITHMEPSAFVGHVPDARRDNRGCQRLHRTTARARRGSSPLHEGNADR